MKATLMLVRAVGALVLLLGLAVWTGTAAALTPIHMLLGLILVIALVAAAILAARAGVSTGLAAVVAIWAIVTLAFGLVQRSLAVGDAHLAIQVVHLLIGLGAIGLGEILGRAAKRARA